MSDYPKYRLKKDTPEFEAGQMFTRGRDEYDNDCLFDASAPLPAFDVSLIDDFDEWFEEVKEASELKQKFIKGSLSRGEKQIKQVHIAALKDGESGYKYTDVQYRFIKPFYYDGKKWGVGVYAKNSTSSQRFYMDDKPDESAYLNKVAFINQLVRDGYIEIQANPNIVWEEL